MTTLFLSRIEYNYREKFDPFEGSKEGRDFFIPFPILIDFAFLSRSLRGLRSSVTPRQIIGFPVHEWSLSVAGRAAWYRGNLIYVFPGLFTRQAKARRSRSFNKRA